MMRLPKIELLHPQSLEEAISFLSRHGDDVRVLAGGTDLIVSLKQRVYTPPYLLNLKTIGDLNYIRKEGKEVKIGPLTPLKDLEASSLISKECPALKQSASRAASPQLRNMGTIGGNICLDTRCMYYNQSQWWRKSIAPCLRYGGEVCHAVKGKHCHAVFQADTPPALIALGGGIRLKGAEGERTIVLEELYRNNGKEHLTLRPAEILAEVIIPIPAPRSAYQRMSLREAIDFPMVGAAVGLMGFIVSFLMNYYVIPFPSSGTINAVSNGISGLLSGFMAGFMGLIVYGLITGEKITLAVHMGDYEYERGKS